MDKTPLQKIQETALIALGPVLTKGEALALKGFLVLAFDAGSQAQRDLGEAALNAHTEAAH